MCVEPRDLRGEPATYGQHMLVLVSLQSAMQIVVDTHTHAYEYVATNYGRFITR